jgi:hypothetical protein
MTEGYKAIIAVLGAALLGLFLALAFNGCATSAGNLPGDPLGMFTQAIQKGFVNADQNFHLAVTNGDLKIDDPIIPCFDALVGPQPSATAQPYNSSGLIESASVAYIRVNSIQSKQQLLNVSCNALIGKFVSDAMKNAPINPARPILGG